MCEGGKIDWAGHANDALATIGDTLDLDDAAKVAFDFALDYPKETLIIVTGDHETGGMTIVYSTDEHSGKQGNSISHCRDSCRLCGSGGCGTAISINHQLLHL